MIKEELDRQIARAAKRYTEARMAHGASLKKVASARKSRKNFTQLDTPQRIKARCQFLAGTGTDDSEIYTDERVFERILHDDDLLSSDFLRTGSQVSMCVGRIHIKDRFRRPAGFGTGFMISSRLMMTNNHVLKQNEDAENSEIEFDYVQRVQDSNVASSFFSLDPATFFVTSAELDYTIVAVGHDYAAGEARNRGWLTLIGESGKLLVGERVNVVQHPKGGYQKVGLRRNELMSVAGHFLTYTTDTEPGSSGSPVCNDQWLLAGLHHAGVPEYGPNGKVIRWVANEGVRVSSIVGDVLARLNQNAGLNDLIQEAFTMPPRRESLNLPRGSAAGVAASAAGSTISLPLQLNISLATGDIGQIAAVPNLPPSRGQVEPAAEDGTLDEPPGSPAFFAPSLECLVIQLQNDADEESVRAHYGQDWIIEKTVRLETLYAFVPRLTLDVTEAWDAVYVLREDKLFASVEPSWEVDAITEIEVQPATYELFGLSKAEKAAKNKRWAPEMIGVRRAWDVPSSHGKSRGEGIRVAHPDSGYTRHYELVEPGALIDGTSGYDFVSDDADPTDKDGYHGTGTASVLLSGEDGDIMGVAPLATLVPMRVAQKGMVRPAPLLLRSGMSRLTKAFHRAIDQDCHVISISLGWFGNKAIKAAVREAWEKDIIIVAAAGNFSWRLIAWPARYPEAICMAGCDALRGKWSGSARGPRVDFTGPARDVWKAGFANQKQDVMQSSGTSFAAAMTAGIAALWLAHHGRDGLIEQYQPHGVRLAEVFREVMKRSVDAPPPNLLGGFGGIVNAERALLTALPHPTEVRSLVSESLLPGIDSEMSPNLATALELIGENTAAGRLTMADWLGVSETELTTIADGCGDELAFHAALTPVLGGKNESMTGGQQMSARLSAKLKAN